VFTIPKNVSQSETSAVYDALDDMFKNIRAMDRNLKHNIKRNKSMICEYKSRGLTYFPSNSAHDYALHGKAVSVHNIRELLAAHYPVINRYWERYESRIASMINVDKDMMEEHGNLLFVRYSSMSGLWMHLDNVVRSDSTIFTVGFGRDHVSYDFAPSLLHKYTKEKVCPLRTTFPNGSLCAMEGEARYQWSHGVPYGEEGIKFTLLFLLKHFEHNQKCLGTEPTLNCKMYTMF